MTFQDIKFALDCVGLAAGIVGLFLGLKWLRESK